MKHKFIVRNILLGLSFVLLISGLYLIFLFVPTEETMGVVQRIFYLHVPVAWVAFLAFFVVFVFSILYLWKRDIKWDNIAHASAEVGIVFTSLVLITGPIWAKPIWGVWWTWDARLTTALILWFIYIAYLIVRSYAGEGSRGARFGAVVGIVGFIDVPISFLAITLWRTQHPPAVIFQGGLEPSMLLTLIICVVAFTTLYTALLIQQTSLKNDENKIDKLIELHDSKYNQ
jgi:heme exporter protein C